VHNHCPSFVQGPAGRCQPLTGATRDINAALACVLDGRVHHRSRQIGLRNLHSQKESDPLSSTSASSRCLASATPKLTNAATKRIALERTGASFLSRSGASC
jgi:hypothetical protein